MKLGRLVAVRPLVLAVGAATTVVALLVVFFVVGWIGARQESQNQQAEDADIARVIASGIGADLRAPALAPYQAVLTIEHERVTVTQGTNHIVLGAKLPPGSSVAHVTRRIPGGYLTVASTIDPGLDPPIEFVVVTVAVLLLVLGSVIAAGVAASRETRRRVDAAVAAAERVASGDFSVRVGEEGPEPLARLGRSFDIMAGRLAMNDREQRQFLVDVAHEIATPVQSLAGFSKAVIDGTIPRERAALMIDSQSRRLADLLDELAELRSLDNPRHIDIEPIELGKLCQQMVEEFAPMAHAGGIDLTCTPTEVVVQTERSLIKTVLRNLVTNALRYTPAGESITISNWLERSGVVVSVRDTGAGIAPEHQERIFDRFYRTEAARDRITGGTGLGLSIARGAATALAGHIEVKSELGTGSDFRLTLPRTDIVRRTDGDSHPRKARSNSAHPT